MLEEIEPCALLMSAALQQLAETHYRKHYSNRFKDRVSAGTSLFLCTRCGLMALYEAVCFSATYILQDSLTAKANKTMRYGETTCRCKNCTTQWLRRMSSQVYCLHSFTNTRQTSRSTSRHDFDFKKHTETLSL